MSLLSEMGTITRTEILKRTFPTGAIAVFAMETPPAGWLKCNGQEVSRTSYSSLYDVIGTTYGIGNGTTTFNVPDLRGEFVRGFDDGRGVDTGRTFGSLQSDEIKSHTHSNVSVNGSNADNGDAGNYVVTAPTQFNSLTNVGGSVGATGGIETRPRNMALMYCIKAYGTTINEGFVDMVELISRLDAVEAALGTGTIISVAKNEAPPGYLKCHGQQLSRTEYHKLFAAIGTTYGNGDGLNTFNIPDFRGQFTRGFDDGKGIDSGRVFGSSQNDAFQGHLHANFTNPSKGYSTGGTTYDYLSSIQYGSGVSGVGSPTSDGGNGVPRTSSETRPKNIAVLFCIKY